MKNFFVLTIALIAFGVTVEGQEIPKVIPPSPNAASLGQYANNPVGTYTGIPEINIPIYTIKVRDITVPISLSYHAGGIKVEQESSWVGLGWALNAGGLITRTIRGESGDDFLHPEGIGFGEPGLNIPRNSFLSEFCEVSDTATSNMIVQTDILSEPGSLNLEPDLFYYNFLKKSGKFVFGEGGQGIIHLFKQEKMKISVENNWSWTITTADGFKYFFGNPVNWGRLINEGTTFVEWEILDFSVTAWYLRKIISPLGEEVTFEYELGDNTRSAPSFSVLRCEKISSQPVDGICEKCGEVPQQTSRNSKAIYLSKILFQHGYVKFESQAGREDLRGGRSLSAIKVYETGKVTPVKEFRFEHSYITAQNSRNYNSNHPEFNKRMMLDRLININPENTKEVSSHQFIYNSEKLPTKTSFARDYWGYFNGETRNSTLLPEYFRSKEDKKYGVPRFYYEGAKRDVSALHMKAQMLEKIIYPTGGFTEFEYEPNDYSNFTEHPSLEGSVTVDVDNIDPSTSLPFDYPVSNSVPFTIDNAGDPSVLEVEVIMANLDFENICYDPITGDATSIFEQSVRIEDEFGNLKEDYYYITQPCGNGPSYQATFYIEDFPPGNYNVFAQIGELDKQANVSVKVKWLEKNTSSNKKLAGGLRVKKIIDHDGFSSANDQISIFDYGYTDPVLGISSFGKIMLEPAYGYFSTDHVKTLDPITASDFLYTCFMRSSRTNPLLINAGSIVTYDKVAVTHGKNGENGKTVYCYKNEVPLAARSYFRPFTPAAIPNTNGLLDTLKEYNAEGKELKETINEYVAINSKKIYGMQVWGRFIDCVLLNNGVYDLTNCPFLTNNGNGPCILMGIEVYPVYSDLIRLRKTTEITYNQNDNSKFIKNITHNEYEKTLVHYQIKKSNFSDSEGNEVITEFTYPADIGSGAPAAMWNENDPNYQHMHSQVVEKKVFRNSNLISRKVNNYSVVANNPEKIVIAPQSIDSYPSGSSEKVSVFLLYDNEGNIIDSQKNDDFRNSYVWGYGATLPVVQSMGINSGFLEFSVAWAINSLPAYSNGIDDLDVLLNDVSGLENESKKNTWRNFNAMLRDRLEDAQITTYTYDPLIGITSQTDPNGITTYYEYDDLGRLKLIRDHEDNILQHYEYYYHDAGQ